MFFISIFCEQIKLSEEEGEVKTSKPKQQSQVNTTQRWTNVFFYCVVFAQHLVVYLGFIWSPSSIEDKTNLGYIYDVNITL